MTARAAILLAAIGVCGCSNLPAHAVLSREICGRVLAVRESTDVQTTQSWHMENGFRVVDPPGTQRIDLIVYETTRGVVVRQRWDVRVFLMGGGQRFLALNDSVTVGPEYDGPSVGDSVCWEAR